MRTRRVVTDPVLQGVRVVVAAPQLGEDLGILQGDGGLTGERPGEPLFLTRVLAFAHMIDDLEQADGLP